jgi:small-conductance mechanosensitive channel
MYFTMIHSLSPYCNKGAVIRHKIRPSRIETFDGKEIMVPNEDFITHRVTNWTYSNAQGRIEINVGVAYESDIKHAQALILDAAKSHPQRLLLAGRAWGAPA